MKKLVAILALVVSTSAYAGGGHHHGSHHHYRWVAPAVIGAVVGAVITAPVYAAPTYNPPVYVQQPNPYYGYPSQPQVYYRSVDVYIPECNCTRTIRVPMQ